MGQSRPRLVYFRSFHIIQVTNVRFELYKLKKRRRCAWESNPGRKAQTNLLSYGTTPTSYSRITLPEALLRLGSSNLVTRDKVVAPKALASSTPKQQ